MIQMEPVEGGGVRDAHGVWFESPRALLMSSDAGGLGWCGCGDPDSVLDLVRRYLETTAWAWEDWGARHQERNAHAQMDQDAWMLLEYVCDAAGWTEHGGSVGGAWLTEEGRHALSILQQPVPEEP